MKKFLLFISFFSISPFVFILAVIFSLSLSYQKNPSTLSASFFTPVKTVNYAALPSVGNAFSVNITSNDGRVEMIRQFLAKYNSPLEPYANNIVDAADMYGLDFRLLPAIAMQESNLCNKMPKNSYNCWGFGIYGGKVTMFSDYPEAIDIVTKTLATKYKQLGLTTPDEIMSIYTPSSNGSWAYGVNQFMDQLR